MHWIKDGKLFDGRLELDGKVMFIAGDPDPELMRRAGYVEYVPPAPEPPDMTAFDAACEQFRAVCGQIAEAANLPGFKGGFDEMVKFQQSEIFATLEGMQLATAWNAADKLCTYEASKIGIGQPAWWYHCWSETDETADNTPESAESAPEITAPSETDV